MTKIKKRYGKWGGYLPHCVDRNVPSRITIEEVKEPKYQYYLQVNDKFFRLNLALASDTYRTMGFMTYGVLLFLIIGRLSIGEEISYFGSFVFFLLGSLFMLYYYKHPKKELVLDRIAGEITFPNYFYGKPFKMPFKDCLVAWSVKNAGVVPSGPSLSLFHPNGFTSTDINISGIDVLEDWCFMVWYMDKNRPLPPGSAFDQYRQQDFERRKAEGFPKPLFPGSFPTPEFTKKQQAERKRVGGW